MQQHQLRLNLDTEAARSLEQAQQHFSERNLAQRLIENGFAYRTDGGLEFIHPRIRRSPAGFDMQLGDALVIAVEKGNEILREVILVGAGKRPHDAEIQRNITSVECHQDIARMHVGMKETVAEHLRIKDLDPVRGKLGQIDPRLAQRADLADRDAVHALHHHHLGGTPVPVYFRNKQQLGVGKIAAQLAGIGRFAHHVELVVQVLVEFGDNQLRLQPLAVFPPAFDQARTDLQQRDVMLDDIQDAGAQNLDRNLASVRQHRKMHLGNGGAGLGDFIEFGKNLAEPFAICLFQQGHSLFRRKGRHLILQLGQFIGDIGGDQVAARGKQLAKLDEDGTQRFQRQTQTFGARAGNIAEEQ